jgi:hypothetical protein
MMTATVERTATVQKMARVQIKMKTMRMPVRPAFETMPPPPPWRAR